MKQRRTHDQPAAGISRREMLRVAGAAAAASALESVAGAQAGETPAVRARAGGLFRMEAKPAPFVIDTAKTAVMVVDMQNDFGAKGGMFDRAGIDISMIQAAVVPTAR